MKKKYNGLTQLDPNLEPCYWANRDRVQSHYLTSVLSEQYIGEIDQFPVIECKAGTATMMPHRYYKVSTRDGSPARGGMILGEALEALAKASVNASELNYSKEILPS